MWSSTLPPPPMQVAAAMFTPASLIAAATSASAPGVLSSSMVRSKATRPRDYRARQRRVPTMCRNIRTLYNFDPPASEEEIRAAALQYVRKISGFTKPSRANEEAFAEAVEAVTAASARLIAQLSTTAPPKDREAEAAKARARAAQRFAA